MKTPCAHPGVEGQSLPDSARRGNEGPLQRAAKGAGLQEDRASQSSGQPLLTVVLGGGLQNREKDRELGGQRPVYR